MTRTYVIDGGPCTGKSSVIKELRRRGHATVKEAARPIIAREQRRAAADPGYDPVLPWTDLHGFQYLVAEATIGRLRRATDDLVFMDRHLASQIAYYEEAGEQPPMALYDVVRQHPITRVFIPEQLPFVMDEQRREDPEEAASLHQRITDAYQRIGADIVTVPRFDTGSVQGDISARADYILERLVDVREHTETERKYRVSHREARKRLRGIHTTLEYAGLERSWVWPGTDGYERFRERRNEREYTVKRATSDPDTRHETSTSMDRRPEIPPGAVRIENRTQEYRALANPAVVFSFDRIAGVGEFLEVEALTTEHLDTLEERLGLEDARVGKAYWELVRAA